MIITHYANSFVTIKSGATTLACDPWLGYGNENAWLSYPIFQNGEKTLNSLNPKFVYISHMHCDHLDPQILKHYKNKKTIFIIKKFKNPRLKNKILNLGFKNILELDAWKKYKISKEFCISIVPQMDSYTSNSEDSHNVKDEINYDLDTSIVVQCNKTKKVFYNNVDNPVSLSGLKKIKAHIKKHFSTNCIDIICLPTGAAGEYPQCFLNIKRKTEQKKIIKNHLDSLKKQISILSPKIFFPAGGIYVVYGKFSRLNKYLAIPKNNQVKKIISKKTSFIELLGGKSIDLENNKKNIINSNFNKMSTFKAIKITNNKKYFYEKNLEKNINTKNYNDYFVKSKINYFDRLKNYKFKTNWKIVFNVYKNLKLNKSCQIDFKKSKFIQSFEIIKNTGKKNKNNFTTLELFLDLKLFCSALTRSCAWNPAIAGSVILYKRKPNKFDPNVISSINFLTL